MNQGTRGTRGGAILPAPACDLLDRLTEELAIHFTLTDLQGTVVASTGGRPAGTVEPRAVRLLERGELQAADVEGDGAVLLPVRLSGRVAGALITHGAPDVVGAAARTAAVSIGMALDFSEAAAAMAQENVNPGWLLYRLFRGSRDEAQQTRVMSAIYGWNLCVQRVAIVAVLSDDTATATAPAPRRGEEPLAMLHRLLGRTARETPVGQLDESQWVLLPAFEPGEPWGRMRDLAEAVRGVFAATGVRADVGLGEPHLPVNPVSALRRSYREAVYAARLGPRLGGKSAVHELRSLGPAAFFAPSSPSRRNLAALVLDPLRGHPAALDTLRAYLALDLSVAETAAQLQVHRHTVRNHLERVFTLTGLDPRSLEGALQLKLALLVAASDPEIVAQ